MITLEEKTEWMAELRSGRHQQIAEEFANGQGGYCALGLLAKIIQFHKGCNWGHAVCLIPLTDGEQSHVVGLNDGGADFNTIADWVEKNIHCHQLELTAA